MFGWQKRLDKADCFPTSLWGCVCKQLDRHFAVSTSTFVLLENKSCVETSLTKLAKFKMINNLLYRYIAHLLFCWMFATQDVRNNWLKVAIYPYDYNTKTTDNSCSCVSNINVQIDKNVILRRINNKKVTIIVDTGNRSVSLFVGIFDLIKFLLYGFLWVPLIIR